MQFKAKIPIAESGFNLTVLLLRSTSLLQRVSPDLSAVHSWFPAGRQRMAARELREAWTDASKFIQPTYIDKFSIWCGSRSASVGIHILQTRIIWMRSLFCWPVSSASILLKVSGNCSEMLETPCCGCVWTACSCKLLWIMQSETQVFCS